MESLEDLLRKRLSEADASERLPPEDCPACLECGFKMAPVLWRADAEWDFYCVRGCYACIECGEVFRFDQTCEHDFRFDELEIQ